MNIKTMKKLLLITALFCAGAQLHAMYQQNLDNELKIALKYNNENKIIEFLHKGANPNILERDYSMGGIMEAKAYDSISSILPYALANNYSYNTIKTMIECGATLSHQPFYHTSSYDVGNPLIYVIKQNNYNLSKLLLFYDRFSCSYKDGIMKDMKQHIISPNACIKIENNDMKILFESFNSYKNSNQQQKSEILKKIDSSDHELYLILEFNCNNRAVIDYLIEQKIITLKQVLQLIGKNKHMPLHLLYNLISKTSINPKDLYLSVKNDNFIYKPFREAFKKYDFVLWYLNKKFRPEISFLILSYLTAACISDVSLYIKDLSRRQKEEFLTKQALEYDDTFFKNSFWM